MPRIWLWRPRRPTLKSTTPNTLRALTALLVTSLFALHPLAQDPAPVGGVSARALDPAQLTKDAQGFLDREDPVRAGRAWRELLELDETHVQAWLGLGRVRLMLGEGEGAVDCAAEVLALSPEDQDGMALMVRSTIRCRRFHEAVRLAERYVRRVGAAKAGAELLSAQASSLFRVQRNDESANLYQRVLELDPNHGEAHLRLGSGLTPPRAAAPNEHLAAAVAALDAGDDDAALDSLRAALLLDPGHPVAHRLMGDTLFLRKARTTMASTDSDFLALRALLPTPDLQGVPVSEFIPAYDELSPERQRVVRRSLALFGSRLRKLVVIGGRHDLLGELERTHGRTVP